MISVIDRVSNNPNRYKLTNEETGEVKYITLEYADEPTELGTPINKNVFSSIDNDLKTKAPYNHADGTVRYGESNASNFGHAVLYNAINPTNYSGYILPANIGNQLYNYSQNNKVVTVTSMRVNATPTLGRIYDVLNIPAGYKFTGILCAYIYSDPDRLNPVGNPTYYYYENENRLNVSFGVYQSYYGTCNYVITCIATLK